MIKNEKMVNLGLAMLREEFGEKRVEKAIDAVKEFEVELPTWIFGVFGRGRFGEYFLLEQPEAFLRSWMTPHLSISLPVLLLVLPPIYSGICLRITIREILK